MCLQDYQYRFRMRIGTRDSLRVTPGPRQLGSQRLGNNGDYLLLHKTYTMLALEANLSALLNIM